MAKIMIYPSKYVQGPGEISKLGGYAEGWSSSPTPAISVFRPRWTPGSGALSAPRFMTFSTASAARTRLTASRV